MSDTEALIKKYLIKDGTSSLIPKDKITDFDGGYFFSQQVENAVKMFWVDHVPGEEDSKVFLHYMPIVRESSDS